MGSFKCRFVLALCTVMRNVLVLGWGKEGDVYLCEW